MGSPNAQPDQQHTAFPAPCSGQVARVFCLMVKWDWKQSRRVSEPEGRELGEGKNAEETVTNGKRYENSV